MPTDDVRAGVAASLRESGELHVRLVEEAAGAIIEAIEVVHRCFLRGGKLLLFGNGGSAADAQHVAAEFVGRFARERAALPAIALTTDTSALTAISNDYGFERVFARQVEALGASGDVAVAISTSGNSPNVLAAVEVARARGMTVVGLTGGDGGRLVEVADVCIVVPSRDTARIQECHLTIEHILCDTVERLMCSADLQPQSSLESVPRTPGPEPGEEKRRQTPRRGALDGQWARG